LELALISSDGNRFWSWCGCRVVGDGVGVGCWLGGRSWYRSCVGVGVDRCRRGGWSRCRLLLEMKSELVSA